jgi:hypothetical protein
VPALDADQRGDPAVLPGAGDVAGGEGDREVRRVRRHQAVHGVDLFHRRDHRVGLGQVGGDERGPELRAHPAGPQPGDVGVEVGLHVGEAVDRVSAAGPQLHRQVVVPVDDRHRTQHRGDHRIHVSSNTTPCHGTVVISRRRIARAGSSMIHGP